MPGTEREKAFSFSTTQVSEWSTVGNVPVTGNYTADGKIDVKFVMRYCQLKEKKFWKQKYIVSQLVPYIPVYQVFIFNMKV